MDAILNNLNDSQRKAVEYCDGPQLVIAGAGSGKTRVLTYKIAYLLAQGMKPWNILALTFTNKAANEMKQRIGQLVGQDAASRLQMGTFHSVFARILRVEAETLGFNSNFTIYDEADSRSLLKSIAKEMGLDDKQYKPAAVHHRISMAKNHLISAAEYANDYETQRRDNDAKLPEIGRIFVEYEQRCRQANAMDFDDLLVMTFRLFRDNEEIREKYSQRFQYVLVDEYQDTNYAQQQIVLQLTREHRRICVVGDDAQSIYAFRGANIDNILGFQKVYPESKLFKLEQNYRSTQRIVQAANSLIKKNERQIPKEVFSHNDEGEPLVLKQAYSDKEEASIVCQEIKRIRRNDGCEYHDFAILYRTNAQSRTFEEEMRRQNIPYRIYGGLSFYQRKEIKDIIAYFRLVCNPSDEEAIKRIINYPARGIGNTTIQKISDAARSRGTSFWEVVANPVENGLEVTKGTMQKLADFVAMISGFIGKLASADAHELGREIVQASGISADLFAGNDPEQLSRQQNLEEFLNGLSDFVDTRREEGREREVFLPDFLQEVSLLTDLDSDDGNESRVLLMTIHAAKGLEFPTVFIVGMEESIFPSQMATTMRDLEEERRLFYVAVTRAEKHCILTCAKSRWRYGKMEFSNPSRFLKDIDRKFLRVEGESSSGGFGGFSGRFQMQNSRPVASQFMADRQPKITSPRRSEPSVEPFSDSFKRKLEAASSGRNLRRIPSSSSSSFKPSNSSFNSQNSSVSSSFNPQKSSVSSGTNSPLQVGNIIEHQRFGIGTVTQIEGSGENTKATVEFRHVGTKQLLLKFARYTIVKA
ncbi:MAG: UvrD-helicase domain-containing protein [Prevotella sp.]|nr:UvrD-helicase domain-containing protein [Prevotella sp.]